MTTNTERDLLDRIVWRLADKPGFVSFDLRRWELLAGSAGYIDFDPELRDHLALCKSPRRTSAFGDDVRAIATYTGLAELQLAQFFRLLDAAESIAAAPPLHSSGLLAAARDESQEEATFFEMPPAGAGAATGSLPGWLSRVVDRFWSEERPTAYPRDLDLHVLLHLPVAIIEVPNLRVSDIAKYIPSVPGDHLSNISERRLHACVLAYAGVGIIIVDADANPADRRVSIAHEVGHFIVDYLEPRERLAAHDPDLLDVMDALREPTAKEELSSLISGIPLGVQTHLIERDPVGGHVTRDSQRTEDRAELVAWELLAPRAEAIRSMRGLDRNQQLEVLQRTFGLPSAVATTYAYSLTRLSAREADSWLDLGN